ncbi:hypothetical protein CHS0354_037163 [Potamilus streckersoni]|uniref:ZP domain-containing protein n=1 Tax=Potamilus streckersoni TaxID=2493646 RepID=A0AAE0SWW3_9BIVA|nr:hypothetical protein CHS0354_037163 [Potamilus streckersoni]
MADSRHTVYDTFRIVEITTVSPSGFGKSALANYTNVQGAWYVNITWTPSTSDAGKTHILCFKAMDEMGYTFYVFSFESYSIDNAISSSCTSSGWYIQVDMYRLGQMYPLARESDIYLGVNSCTGYSNGYTLVFQHGIRDCLTSETVTQNALVYRNRLFYAMRDPQYPFIIRGYNWTVEVECDVMRNETASSHISHNTIGPFDSSHVQGTSHYNITMRFYSDPNFQYEIPGNPLHVKVGSDVYVKAYTVANDWGIKMILRSCYTKPDQNASDSLRYYIIRDGYVSCVG